ncbi:hypothetical protein YC2023_062815 [Brassica napus]
MSMYHEIDENVTSLQSLSSAYLNCKVKYKRISRKTKNKISKKQKQKERKKERKKEPEIYNERLQRVRCNEIGKDDTSSSLSNGWIILRWLSLRQQRTHLRLSIWSVFSLFKSFSACGWILVESS